MLSVKKTLGLIVALVFIAPGVHANFIANGTFDTGASGWQLTADCVSNGPTGNTWTSDFGGALQLNSCGTGGTNPNPTAIQYGVGALTVGEDYLLEWENRLHVNSSGANGQSFAVYIDNAQVLTSENLTFNWVADSLTFTAANTSATIGFAAEYLSDVSYYLDNVSLTAVTITRPNDIPEPSVLVLFGLGLLGLGFAGRRKVQS